MNKGQQFWLDWKTKKIYLNQKEYCTWSEVEKIKGIINCSHLDWILINLENKNNKNLEDDQIKRIIKVGDGQRVISEVYKGTKEKPWGEGGEARNLLFEIIPEFSQTHPSSKKDFIEAVSKWKWGQHWAEFEDSINAWETDHSRHYTNILRNYPLPCGKPEHLRDILLIEQALKENKTGFIKFYLEEGYAKIKKKQISFIPDVDGVYKAVIKPYKRLLLHTKLFRYFLKKYKITGKIIFTDFWIFKEKKGCANEFLEYCQKKESEAETKEEKKVWKSKPNILVGILGQAKLGGYSYYPLHLAVIQISLLKIYLLYRKFKPNDVLAIRADAVLTKVKPPKEIFSDPQYRVKWKGVEGKETFDYETEELTSPFSGKKRAESLKKWLVRKKSVMKIK